MVIKCYFDCSWTGPKAEVDGNGKVTNLDQNAAGMSILDPCPLPSPL